MDYQAYYRKVEDCNYQERYLLRFNTRCSLALLMEAVSAQTLSSGEEKANRPPSRRL